VIDCETGNRRGEGIRLFNSAAALDKLNDYPQAITRAEAALQIFEAIESPHAAEVRVLLKKWKGAGRGFAALWKSNVHAKLEKWRGKSETQEVSYELLAEPARRCWILLAIFQASFDLTAAAAIWEMRTEAARNLMEVLLKGRLVETDEAKVRFHLHDSVREFCKAKLSQAERDTAMMRYAGHYTKVGWKVDHLYLNGGEYMLRGLELFDSERFHIEAAFEWLAPRCDEVSASLLSSLVDAVVHISELRFNLRQRIRWLEGQRDAARIVKNRKGEGAALDNLGLAYNDLGEPYKAIEFHEQALVVVREIGDKCGECTTLDNLGLAYRDLGQSRKAIEFHEQALVISRKIGDWRSEGCALGNLGSAHFNLGEPGKSIEYYEQALVILRKIGDHISEGNALFNSALALDLLDNRTEAIARVEAALRIFEAIEAPTAAKVRAQLEKWRGQPP